MLKKQRDDSIISVLVNHFLDNCMQSWWESDDGMPSFQQSYSDAEQAAHEQSLTAFLHEIEVLLKDAPEQRDQLNGRFFDAFVCFSRRALGFRDRHIDMFFKQGFSQSIVEFIKQARTFDPALQGREIYQAVRNVYTMNGIQYLMRLPVRLTPSIFAYSMIYPYSDNILDDAAIATDEKIRFNQRFKRRLKGGAVNPCFSHEGAIYRLLEMIEQEYDRERYPRLFLSLLAIHEAQEKSIQLLGERAYPFNTDILGIALEKGGASVLADGFLVSGEMDNNAAEFLFQYGAFLQLVDDLQDLETDRQTGLATIFSCTPDPDCITLLINRTFHFGRKVLRGMRVFDLDSIMPLKELILKSGDWLLLDAAGRSQKFVHKPYLRKLQPYFPFRYDRLNKLKKQFAQKGLSVMPILQSIEH